MKKSRFTEEQIMYALRQAEGGTPVADVCRQLGVSEASSEGEGVGFGDGYAGRPNDVRCRCGSNL